MQRFPGLWLRFELIESHLEVRVEVALVPAPHDRPVNSQSNLQEDQNIRSDVKEHGGWFMAHREASAAEEAHAQDDNSNYHQDHREDPNNVIWGDFVFEFSQGKS